MIRWDLQWFGEKTEKPTPRRRSDARKKGQVARSMDFTSALTFLTIILSIRLFGGGLLSAIGQLMTGMLSSGTLYAAKHTGVPLALEGYITQIGVALIPILITGMLIGVFVSFLQVGPFFVPTLLLPNFSRIGIFSGVKRLFSLMSLVELLKSIIKLAFIAVAVYYALAGSSIDLVGVMGAPPGAIFSYFMEKAFNILLDVGVMFAVLSLADIVYQRYSFERNLRMSKEDVKEESKQAEGNPQIKRKIRERGLRIALRRMMQKVPTADVVVTNPTHYAVALAYDAKAMQAPQVIAKGVDETARKIKEMARDHDVPIVENRVLARTLYNSVELDGYVPGQLFQAVAEVLAYVYRLKRRVM